MLAFAAWLLPAQAAPQAPQDTSAAPPLAPLAFANPFPADKLAFIKDYAGRTPKELKKDKRFRELMSKSIPRTTFHYGHDLPLYDAVEAVLDGPPLPVDIGDGR